LALVATQLAAAFGEWPRLVAGLEASAMGTSIGFACSPTRAWFRFVQHPSIERGVGDEVYLLARRKPYALTAFVSSIALIHFRLVKTGALSRDVRDKTVLSLLCNAVRNDSTGSFVSVKRDMPRCERERQREALKHSDRMTASVFNTVVEAGPTTSNSPISDPALVFSR
jgi:hypothetical protein